MVLVVILWVGMIVAVVRLGREWDGLVRVLGAIFF